MALILGTKIIEHDACFALFENDKPIFVYEQERFNRIKHGFTYSIDALEYGLQKYGYSIEDIDYVTNYLDEVLVKDRLDLYLDAYGKEYITNAYLNYNNSYQKAIQYKAKLLSLGFKENQIINVRHHLGHCAAVFYPSPYEEAAILSIDGGGEAETCVLAYGKGENIEILKSIAYPHSLGHLYETVTRWLGWGFGEEGKAMALASYGTPIYYDDFIKKLIDINKDGTFSYKVPFFGSDEDIFFKQLVGKRRKVSEELSQHHKDVAATVQFIIEEIMIKLSLTLKKLTGSDNLLITGGVGLNSVANGKVVENNIFKNVLAYPQANDAGLAIGGALFANYTHVKNKRKQYWIMEGAYLGREIDIENVESIAQKYQITYEYYDDITEITSQLIAQNNIIAWVQGREEIGPRALGNRSIIANPLNPKMKDLINERVKFRETWRPFAPSVLEEDSHNFFELNVSMPYMLIVSKVKKAWRDKLLSILHVDNTARVQTVNKQQNALYYKLLTKVKEKISIGMLLNTSYNVKGEPVVQTVEQAIADFLRTDIDILVIGNYLFKKSNIKNHIIVKDFHPINTNIIKLKQKKISYIGIFKVAGHTQTINDYLLASLKEHKIKKVLVNIYNMQELLMNDIDAILIVLKINPFNINHLNNNSFINLIALLIEIENTTSNPIFFEFRGDIFELNDVKFLLEYESDIIKDESLKTNLKSKNIVECPVCEENNFTYLLNAFTQPDKNDLYKELQEKLLMCTKCNTIIKAPREIEKEDSTEYGLSYYNQMSNINMDMNTTIYNHIMYAQIPIYMTFEKFINEKFDYTTFPNWLDVGSSGFPTMFKNYNFTTIEPDPRTVYLGQKLFNKDHITCNVLEEYKTDKKFNGIIFHHSLYCIPNPKEVLNKANKLLEDGGVIVVAIEQFSMQTSSVFEDNKFLRLEDIFRGETLNIYYNPYAIEYLFQKHGFILEDSVILKHQYHPSNKNYSSKYFVFKKDKNITINEKLIQKSHDFHNKLLSNTFNQWHADTTQVLNKFNTNDTVFIGEYKLFKELNTIIELDNIHAFVDIDIMYDNNYSVDNTHHVPLSSLSNLTNFNIVICSFEDQINIINKLKKMNVKNIYAPTRKSKINNMYFEFQRKKVLTKAFIVQKI